MPNDNNPLLQAYDLPPFSRIQAEHFSPALDRILTESRDQVAAIIETQTPFPTWDDLVLAMDEIHARLKGFDYLLNRLTSTRTGDTWTQASLDCSERLQDFQRSLKQNSQLFQLYQRLADSPIAQHFTVARKRTLKKILRQFRLEGLASTSQADLNDLKLRIRGARSLFLEHLHEANRAWSKTFDDEAQLSGLPSSFKQDMAERARKAGRKGWLLTLNEHSFRVVSRYADNQLLRKQMYVAYSTRASDQGPHAGQFDNGEVLSQLLRDCHQYATLLGYSNYAQMVLEAEQAESPEQVLTFLQGQLEHQQSVFIRDAEQLETFAAQQGFSELQPWNYQYLAQKLRQQTAGVSEQTVSAWFTLESTFSQLLLIAKELFGVDIVERREVATWHAQVRLFEVRERDETIGYVYFDPFEDANQEGFPHTTAMRNRRITAEGRPRHPIAVLHGWLPRGSGASAVLLDHRQLRILFHEFGHCLHHVLARAEYHDISGISELSRDTAEFAGVLFEQWCFTKQCLIRISKHHQTGAPLPDKVADQLLLYLNTQTSWEIAGFLRDALFDMELHCSHGDGQSAQQIFDRINTQVGHLPVFMNERWPNGLDYLVTGYAAGIYAYAWSRAMAKIVFQRFKRAGLFNPQTGRALRETIFGPGDSRPLSESIQAFLDT
ncbi:oligopeptidase A [Pseudomonas sp. 43mfcvi1.1]|uniref:M3 family metallopeptidase n=1 Tax=Pseudomonas sp. 43mfcvi1.1 TaxID=1761894 RepID=UPI000D6D2699|nr:M3 family metallopeptidase [Pseudomonas sp. 43mfcvi1.1]PWJ39927.1 oligopeptidase A [Pseudomonas sp. 43mfcvi1.1]SSB95917.1 oligopeptidase A [Pseudomonas sp. 43mfcvi1.1]